MNTNQTTVLQTLPHSPNSGSALIVPLLTASLGNLRFRCFLLLICQILAT